ncbi:MAG: helix-turn-helix transcriptional regulator [Actinobacteria bacterium]|nr:MAG: helix-turn-helix transcriptional regulator [Actinomycetota bacterium]
MDRGDGAHPRLLRRDGESEGVRARARAARACGRRLGDLRLDRDVPAAQQLVISPKTVSTHIQRILGKLEVRSRAQAVAVVLHERAASVARAH